MINGKLILSMALLLLVAGCVSTQRPVKVSASDGLQINEFSADINDVFGQEPVTLSLEVENVGGTTAKYIIAKLFGGNSGWGGNDASNTPKALGAGTDTSLIPPLIETNKAGGFSRKIWSITAPDLPQGLAQSFDIGVRIRYDYTTTSITPVDVISFAQFDQLRKKGTFEQGTTATQNSNAPVRISIEVSSPITQQAADTSISEPVTLSFVNVGSGIAFNDKTAANLDFPAQSTLGKVSFNIIVSKGTLTCDNADGTSAQTSGIVTLRRGFDTVKLPCTLTLAANDLTVGVPKDTITVTVTTDYSYAIDGTASIKVTSKK